MSFFNKAFLRQQYITSLLIFNVYAGMTLMDKYFFKVIGCHGPSMIPTFDKSDNLLIVDCFTTRFVRKPNKGEIVIADNPFKHDATLVKRVLWVEQEMAEFWSDRNERMEKVYIPPGHVWIEGDNKDHSRDSRDFGPISLCLIDGIVRARIWPLDKLNTFDNEGKILHQI